MTCSYQLCRYEQSLQERRDKYLAIKGLLDEQVREREGIKQSKDALQQQEAHELTKLWQGEEAAEKAAAEQERLHQQAMYNEMLNENRSHLSLIC